MTDGVKDVPIKTSIFGSDWNVPESGNYAYQQNYTSLGASTTKGTKIIDKTVKVGADTWEDYMMIGYVNLVPTPHVDHKIGFVMRYQDSSNYYFIGFKTETTGGGVGDNKSTYEVYKVASDVYTRIANQYNTGNNYDNGTEAYFGLPNTVGTDGVLAEDTQYHFRVEIYDVVCRAYISNVLVFQNTTGFGDYTEGEVGMEAYTENNTDIISYFDNIKVVS
jgi:hypothetical protein